MRRIAGLIGGLAAAIVAGFFVADVVRGPTVEEADGRPIVPPAPDAIYDPTLAGESLPEGYRVALPRDAILPVYNPKFTAAESVDWPEDMLVIGVAGDQTAKAYPVTHLNSREMVIDSLEGIPILVSW